MAADFPYLYPHSRMESGRMGQVQMHEDSFRVNVDCARAIEQAVRDYFNEADETLNKDCAQSVLERFGFKRVTFVLANSLREFRQSASRHLVRDETYQWGRGTFVPSDGRYNHYYAVDTSAPLLESFISQTSADYNSMNGWPAGTPIPGTEFEIYHCRTGNLVDTVRTDRNGVAVSEPLPLGRYKIVESKAADFYGLDKTPIEVEIEHAGQIVKAAMTNKSLCTNVSIKKTGFVEVMPGQQIRYDFSGIANNSTTALTSFYWRDNLPTQAVRLDKIVTGTYNVRGNYKIVFRTNLSGEYRTMYDNLSTMQNYVLDASPAALGLASNEYVTEFMVSFGVVPASFRQAEAPKVYCNVVSWLTGGAQFVNQADAGGVYNGQWIMATSRWLTRVCDGLS